MEHVFVTPSGDLHERWLQGILSLVLLLIGLRYLRVF